MDVDPAGGDDFAHRIELRGTTARQRLRDRDDCVAAYADVADISALSAAVDDRAAADHEVVLGSRGSGRRRGRRLAGDGRGVDEVTEHAGQPLGGARRHRGQARAAPAAGSGLHLTGCGHRETVGTRTVHARA